MNQEKSAVRHCCFGCFERFGTVVFTVFGTVVSGVGRGVRFGTVIRGVRHCYSPFCAVRHCCSRCSALLFTLFGTVIESHVRFGTVAHVVRHC
jgi:hypothetical protein